MKKTRQSTKSEVKRLTVCLFTKGRLDEEDLHGMSQMRKRTVLHSLKHNLKDLGMTLLAEEYGGRWRRVISVTSTLSPATKRM